MWELQEVVGSEHIRTLAISQPCIIKFGDSKCDVDLRPAICGEVAKISVIAMNGLHFTLSENVQGQSSVNSVLLSKQHQCIKSGDVIQFRCVPNKKFILMYKEINILFSSIGRDVKKRAKAVATLIRAKISSEWSSECNVLVMQTLIVTSKVICALLSCIPIVTPDYLEEIKKIRGYTFAAKPNPKDFLPIVKEEKLTQNDAARFLPNDLRPSLFSGKVFFVLNKDKYNILSEIIRLGNGKSYLVDSHDALVTASSNIKVSVSGHNSSDDLIRDILSRPEICVVHFHPTPVSESWQRKLYSVLRSLHRRPILESELGFAVVYCSIKLYCNPDKRCPDGLYHEIDISGTFSVNPFQIDSEFITSELSQSSTTMINTKLPDSSDEKFSLTAKNMELDAGLKLKSCQTARSCEHKFGSTTSRIVPVKTPEHITVGSVLVHDSEPIASQRFIGSPQTTPLDLENQEPFKSETNLNNSISTTTFVHQPSVRTEKDDLLDTLNSMPSLLQATMRKGTLLEPNNNDKNDATQLFSSLSAESFDSSKPEIPKYEFSISRKDSNSSFVTESNSCSAELNNGPLISSNNKNCVSKSWLRKHPTDNVANNIDTQINLKSLVIFAPMPTPANAQHTIMTVEQLNKVNFKNFNKVWPTYVPQNTFIKPRVPSSYLSKPIPLASYQQTPEKLNSHKCVVKSKQLLDDEQEQIKKLFEESCKAPSLQKLRKLTTF
ncbi:unnamed protein product [Schistosoma turkestanicum]|nr:unnamed protein product [Schistosoma turkestanicum]